MFGVEQKQQRRFQDAFASLRRLPRVAYKKKQRRRTMRTIKQALIVLIGTEFQLATSGALPADTRSVIA